MTFYLLITFEEGKRLKTGNWASLINLALHYFFQTKYKFFVQMCPLTPPPLSRIYFNQLKWDIHIVFTIMYSRLTFYSLQARRIQYFPNFAELNLKYWMKLYMKTERASIIAIISLWRKLFSKSNVKIMLLYFIRLYK